MQLTQTWKKIVCVTAALVVAAFFTIPNLSSPIRDAKAATPVTDQAVKDPPAPTPAGTSLPNVTSVAVQPVIPGFELQVFGTIHKVSPVILPQAGTMQQTRELTRSKIGDLAAQLQQLINADMTTLSEAVGYAPTQKDFDVYRIMFQQMLDRIAKAAGLNTTGANLALAKADKALDDLNILQAQARTCGGKWLFLTYNSSEPNINKRLSVYGIENGHLVDGPASARFIQCTFLGSTHNDLVFVQGPNLHDAIWTCVYGVRNFNLARFAVDGANEVLKIDGKVGRIVFAGMLTLPVKNAKQFDAMHKKNPALGWSDADVDALKKSAELK